MSDSSGAGGRRGGWAQRDERYDHGRLMSDDGMLVKWEWRIAQAYVGVEEGGKAGEEVTPSGRRAGGEQAMSS